MKIEERLKIFENHIKRAEDNYEFLKSAPGVSEDIIRDADDFMERLNKEYEKIKMEFENDNN